MLTAFLLVPNFGTALFKFMIFTSLFDWLMNTFFGANYNNVVLQHFTTLFTTASDLLGNLKHYLTYVFYFIPYDYLKVFITMAFTLFILRLVFSTIRLASEAF